MITTLAWTEFLTCLTDIYFWADSHIVVDFAGYSLSLLDLWLSACIIAITVETVIFPVFGGGKARTLSLHTKNNDGG